MGKTLHVAEKIKFLDNFVYPLRRLWGEKKNKEIAASDEIVMNQYAVCVNSW
jgi:hypothetical protein